MKNKRILLTAIHPVGGIKTFFRYIYASEQFDEYDLVFVTPDEDFKKFANEFIPKAEVRTVDGSGQRFLKSVRKLVCSGEYDIVHSHGFTAGLYTQIAVTGCSIRHVMTAHDVFTKRQFAGLKGKVKQYTMSAIFQRIDTIHTVTQAAEINFLKYFPKYPKSKIKCIVHGVDSQAFADATPRKLRAELEQDDETVLFGFFGRFMAQKGFRVIVHAVEILKSQGVTPTQLKVCTFGWGGFIREDYEYLNGLGLTDYFVQMPATNDMPSSIKGVDCVLMPSQWEACGLLAMESLSAATPIISTNCVGLDEVTENTPALIMNINDTDKLVENMTSIISKRLTYKDAFSDFQSEAVERFSIERPINGIVNLYREL